MDISPNFLKPLLGFIITLIFGFWLSWRGKPYNGLLFNVHKLIALGTVIFAGITVYQLLKDANLVRGILLLLGIAAICVIALFTSGALMSAGKGDYRVMKLVHNIAPVLGAFTMGFIVYLL